MQMQQKLFGDFFSFIMSLKYDLLNFVHFRTVYDLRASKHVDLSSNSIKESCFFKASTQGLSGAPGAGGHETRALFQCQGDGKRHYRHEKPISDSHITMRVLIR